jgi:hypothetical protein
MQLFCYFIFFPTFPVWSRQYCFLKWSPIRLLKIRTGNWINKTFWHFSYNYLDACRAVHVALPKNKLTELSDKIIIFRVIYPLWKFVLMFLNFPEQLFWTYFIDVLKRIGNKFWQLTSPSPKTIYNMPCKISNNFIRNVINHKICGM